MKNICDKESDSELTKGQFAHPGSPKPTTNNALPPLRHILHNMDLTCLHVLGYACT